MPAGIEPSAPPSDAELRQLLRPMAARTLWWLTPEEAVQDPDRVIAQVMELGDFDDVMALRRRVGDGRLRRVLRNSPAGRFSPRSWNYWHLRLGLAAPGAVPPPPVRRFAEP